MSKAKSHVAASQSIRRGFTPLHVWGTTVINLFLQGGHQSTMGNDSRTLEQVSQRIPNAIGYLLL